MFVNVCNVFVQMCVCLCTSRCVFEHKCVYICVIINTRGDSHTAIHISHMLVAGVLRVMCVGMAHVAVGSCRLEASLFAGESLASTAPREVSAPVLACRPRRGIFFLSLSSFQNQVSFQIQSIFDIFWRDCQIELSDRLMFVGLCLFVPRQSLGPVFGKLVPQVLDQGVITMLACSPSPDKHIYKTLWLTLVFVLVPHDCSWQS